MIATIGRMTLASPTTANITNPIRTRDSMAEMMYHINTLIKKLIDSFALALTTGSVVVAMITIGTATGMTIKFSKGEAWQSTESSLRCCGSFVGLAIFLYCQYYGLAGGSCYNADALFLPAL